MGLGLYYANIVMELGDGTRFAFPSAEDADVPDQFDGAVVALVSLDLIAETRKYAMRDTPAQIITVDNNENHLRAIVDTFQSEGIACLGLRYDSEVGLNANHFRGVRVLFCDLHLLETATFGGREHYGHLAQLLNDNISPDGGPS